MSKRTIKIIAIIMFLMCLLFQVTWVIGMFLGTAGIGQSIIRIVLLIVAEVIIIKAYPAYVWRYCGPRT